MRSFAFLPLLSIATALTLVAESDNQDVNGKGASSIHEGAGINYFLLGDDGEELSYDESTQILKAADIDTQYPYQVSVTDGNILIAGVLEPSKADISSGYLSIDGSDEWFACKNIRDPYSYTTSRYAVANKDLGDCVSMKLKVDGADSSAPAPSSSSSAVPSAPYGNSTTVYTTVTDYTTYCPYPTTITITTCDEECAPHTITVEEPKTITVTGECVVPTSSETKPAPTTVASTVAAESTTAAESTAPAVSSFDNGANKQMVGLTGLAIVGALLL